MRSAAADGPESRTGDRAASTASVPIYCINLPASRDRRLWMTRRFQQLGLLPSVRFVKAIDGRSRAVDDHLATMNVDPKDPRARAEVACWLSHVRALRTFLRETPATTAAGIVFEDDVLLHREWHQRRAAVLDNLPAGAPVCALGYNDEDWDRPPETWEGFAWAGVDPDRRVLIRSLKRQWGAHAYWISRSHARAVLESTETAGRTRPLPPEAIQKVPGAFAVFPSLAIQDGSPSTIVSEPGRVRTHRLANASWGVENYLDGDDELWGARYRHAVAVSQRDWDRGVNLLLETWEYLPSRPEPLWSLAHGYRLREEYALAGVFASKGLQVPAPDMPPTHFRFIYDWGLRWEWALAAYHTGNPTGAARVCESLLDDPTIPDDVLAEIQDHYRRSREVATARVWQPGDPSQASSLFSVLPVAGITALRLDLDQALVQSDPSVAGDGERLRALIRVSEAANRWSVSYWEVEIGSDLSVVSARPISDRRGPGAAPIAAFRQCCLVSSGSEFLVVARATGSPGGSAPLVLLSLSDGALGPSQVVLSNGTGSPARWAPFIAGGELRFLSGLDPVSVLSVDPETGAITSTWTASTSSGLGEETAASPGVQVAGGTLFVTRRVRPGDLVEHRLVLLDGGFEVAGSSAGFFFFNPTGELCSGLATIGDDIVLSVGSEHQGAFLIRAPYSAAAALL